MPNVDIVVANSHGFRLLSLQVKTSCWAHRSKHYGYELREWDVGASAVGKSSDGLWYAFLDLREEPEPPKQRMPLIFVVPSLWVGSFVQDGWSWKMYMLRREPWEDGEERWDRIEGYLNSEPEAVRWCQTIPEAAKDWSSTPNASGDGVAA